MNEYGAMWNDTDRGKLKYWKRILSHCHTFLYKPNLALRSENSVTTRDISSSA